MSLKRNILASYATQIYVTLVGILILPLYLKYMGAKPYGLVGFFTAHGVGGKKMIEIGLKTAMFPDCEISIEKSRSHGKRGLVCRPIFQQPVKLLAPEN